MYTNNTDTDEETDIYVTGIGSLFLQTVELKIEKQTHRNFLAAT